MNTSSERKTPWGWLLWAGVVLVLDQWTKLWIVAHYQLGDSTPVTSFFNIVRAHNPGAAFSFLAREGGWQRWFFTAIGLIAAVVLIWQLRVHHRQRVLCLGLASLLGGALGNVIDRVVYGYVVDFLDFHWKQSHYPAFNLADSAITLGVILLLVHELLLSKKRTSQS